MTNGNLVFDDDLRVAVPSCGTRTKQAAEDGFELVYHGSLNDLTNPASIIIIQEKEARRTLKGNWTWMELFADGHAVVNWGRRPSAESLPSAGSR